MRVMLLTPNFWTSGTVTFIRELQRGWPAEWPRPVIATATRSGKRSVKWGRPVERIQRADSTPWEPDVCDTRERLVELAREEFDLVHVNEVETTVKQQEWWYETLERLKTPFTVQLHGNRYERVDWSRVRAASSFTGVVWQTPGNVPEGLRRPSVHLVSIPRPWNLRPFVALPRDAVPLVGFHGRLTPDKGVQHVAALSRHAHLDVCLHGASIGGGYPYAYGLQKALFGEVRTRTADAPWTWWAGGGGASLRYEGPYADGVEVSRHHDVHVSATRAGFSAGTEYTLLEAIDAGCTLVQPKHMLEPTSPLRGFTYDWEPRGLVGALRDPLDSLIRAVQTALLSSSYDAGYNRSVVAVRHNPGTLARAFFGAVAGHV